MTFEDTIEARYWPCRLRVRPSGNVNEQIKEPTKTLFRIRTLLGLLSFGPWPTYLRPLAHGLPHKLESDGGASPSAPHPPRCTGSRLSNRRANKFPNLLFPPHAYYILRSM